MARRMDLAPKFSVPDLTTETIGIIGKRGSGKSHTGTLVVEELLELDSQVIVIDPIGGWWGLRAGADAKSTDKIAQGYPIPIFGGLHGDMPLEERGGALLADYLVENRLSAVIDLSDFSKSAMRRFVRDFAERFYLLKNKARDPVHIVIDECDLFVPQRVDSQEMMPLVGAINDFVLRGRQRGIGVTLISQRPARINKDVLTQVEILIAFRMTGPQDIDAFGDWIEHNGTKEEQKEVLGSLSSLERGTGWFWAPGLMDGLLRRVSFRTRHTYDSSRTPDGKRVKPPKTLRDVDLGQLSEAMKKTVERAKADDPKALRAEIARLLSETRILKLEREKSFIESKVKETPILDKDGIKRLQKAIERAEALYSLEGSYVKELETHRAWIAKTIDTWSNRMQPVVTEIGNLRTELKRILGGKEAGQSVQGQSRIAGHSRSSDGSTRDRITASSSGPKKTTPRAGANGDASKVPEDVKVPRSFAVTVAQFGDKGASRSQLTQITGAAGSTRNAYLQRGRNAGIFEEMSGDRHRITDDGIAWLGDSYKGELPTGEELRDHWYRELPGPEAKCLRVLADVYPEGLTRDAVGELLKNEKWATSTRNAYIQRLVRRELAEEVSREHVRMAEILSDG